ncbi:MAG: hypothetical protein CMH62_02225 [Nanoarchaeota archaeon]|nr:hypothetical protein [Nanoarchaeota archaeon]
MNKRGQGGLSMNTIVVAIIAIIILLLLVTFFTGGLGTIGQRITNVFQTGTAGYDLDLAVRNCEDFCARAERLSDQDAVSISAACTQTFDIDTDGDGSPDGEYDCTGTKQNPQVPGVSCSVSC